jgi:hypothetical protein
LAEVSTPSYPDQGYWLHIALHPSDGTGSSRVEDAIGRAHDARRAAVEDVRVD